MTYLVLTGLILVSILAYRYYYWCALQRRTNTYYKSMVIMYTEARSKGKRPQEACLYALEEKFHQYKNIETNLDKVYNFRNNFNSFDIPECERDVVIKMLSSAANIQAQIDSKTSVTKKHEIIIKSLNDFSDTLYNQDKE